MAAVPSMQDRAGTSSLNPKIRNSSLGVWNLLLELRGLNESEMNEIKPD